MMSYARPFPRQAQLELTARTLARRHLLDFTTYTYRLYRPEPAHALIAQALERVLKGEVKRLMIFAPPQHGKTELVSVLFPPFWLAHRPEAPGILTSYGADLAVGKNRQARDVIDSTPFRKLFPEIRLRADVSGKQYWQLDGHRGGMRAAGVGGPITGHPAVLGIIDDPFKSWRDAQSLSVRNLVWD